MRPPHPYSAWLLSLLILWHCTLPSFAAEPKAASEVYPEVKTASGLSRALQGATGFTLLTGHIANRLLRKELAKHVSGPVHTRLTLFSGTDLLHGKAKGVIVSGHDALLEGFIPLSKFRFESQRDMPIFVQTQGHAFLLRPVSFKVSAVMDEKDINRMLQSEQGRRLLSDMRVSMPPFGKESFDALEPSIQLDDGKLIIQSLMNLHGAPKENALPVQMSSRLSPEGSSLNLSDLSIDIPGIRDTNEIAQVIQDYFGELVNLEKLKIDRHRVSVLIDQSEIRSHQLNLAATLTVTPDPKTLRKYFSSLAKSTAKP